jgi:hypothetical protein
MPFKIDLRTFVKEGTFGPFSLGQTKAYIEQLGFAPTLWSGSESKEQALIWCYESVEFHFNDRQHLSSIDTNYVGEIALDTRLQITNWWVLNNSRKHTLASFLKALNSLGLDFQKQLKKPGFIEINIPASGVFFSFDHPIEGVETDHNTWMLHVMGKR